MNGGGNVRGKRPWGRRPDEEICVFFVGEGKCDVYREMRPFLVAFSHNLVLGNTGTATWTPGHDVVSLIDPATFVTGLEKQPDGVVVLIGHREVGVIPVHPIGEALGL